MRTSSVARGCAFVSCLLPLHAQEAAEPKAQPRDLILGSLCEHACVRASFQVFWHGAAMAEQKPVIKAPPFVKVHRSIQTKLPPHGVATQVFLEVATTATGELKGDVEVTCGGKTVRVPVEAVVLPRLHMTSRVLVLVTPFELYAAEDSSLFATWRRIVATGKLEVQYPDAPEQGPELAVELLQRADTVLISDDGLLRMTADDTRLLQGFVCGGGRVVVVASAFFRGTVTKANELLEPFGLRIKDVEPPALLGAIEVGPEDIEKDPLTAKLESLKLRRPSPIQVTDPKRARSLVHLAAFPEHAFAAVSRCESGGEIVALGIPVWSSWIGLSEQNELFLRTLLTRAPRERR